VNKKLKCKYKISVCASDKIPRCIKKPAAYIVNTDKHHSAGTHWISIFFENSNKYEYFDSYGLPPMIRDHINFLSRFKKGS
jgi:hypothetical protein